MNTHYLHTTKSPEHFIGLNQLALKNQPRNQHSNFVDNRYNSLIQRKVNYNTVCVGLNNGDAIANKNELILAIKKRWPHLDDTRVKGIVTDIAKKKAIWSMAQIHGAVQNIVNRESAVPTSTKGRPPTLYTYTHTHVDNAISEYGVPQGPHTLGYSAIHESLHTTTQKRVERSRFKEQIESPKDWWNLIKGELTSSQRKDTILKARLTKAKRSYQKYYDEAIAHFNTLESPTATKGKKQQARTEIKILMNHLMQLHPYATFAWAARNSKPDVSGKGENRDIDDDRNIDKAARFTQMDELKLYIKRRRLLGKKVD
ncbi:hypothetical protein [Rubritalea marina]|uniref:hypothetical protein n=1 Tax=Rubritalea marina TaxID=361055 RepID=UPI00035FDCFF|nr:hypothetical protein [Rubritalea marina]